MQLFISPEIAKQALPTVFQIKGLGRRKARIVGHKCRSVKLVEPPKKEETKEAITLISSRAQFTIDRPKDVMDSLGFLLTMQL